MCMLIKIDHTVTTYTYGGFSSVKQRVREYQVAQRRGTTWYLGADLMTREAISVKAWKAGWNWSWVREPEQRMMQGNTSVDG